MSTLKIPMWISISSLHILRENIKQLLQLNNKKETQKALKSLSQKRIKKISLTCLPNFFQTV